LPFRSCPRRLQQINGFIFRVRLQIDKNKTPKRKKKKIDPEIRRLGQQSIMFIIARAVEAINKCINRFQMTTQPTNQV
jgi:hypothetical protein